jgi:peptidyl-prolyl cis-trans isomerase D
VTPEREKTFDEVAADVKAAVTENERQEAIAALVTKQLGDRKPGESLDRIAKAFNAKVERTSPLKRTEKAPAPLTPDVLKQAFVLAKGDAGSAPTADGKSRIVFRVADITAAPEAKEEQTAALREQLAKQMREDLVRQYIDGLRVRYGATVNEKLLAEAIGKKTSEN